MSQILPHISQLITPGVQKLIRHFSAEAEQLGELHPVQLEAIYSHNWFNLFVPKKYGGLELELVEALQMEEALAFVDGSTGWTVTLCAGANWFVGFLPPETAQEIFTNKKACFAGSGRPSGVAKKNAEGYEITGCWNYATGAPHATIFTANCLVEENGSLLTSADGVPVFQSFWFARNEVEIHQDWNSMGMKATASHSFEVKNLCVSQRRTFIIDAAHCLHQHPIFQFPFLQFAEATLAVNMCGMAACFIDLCESVINEKKTRGQEPSNTALVQITYAVEKLKASRQAFYGTLEHSWNELLSTGTIREHLQNEVSSTSKQLAKISRQLSDELYPYCGMVAADPRSEINRVWRNMHTASQHSLLL